VLAWEKQKCSLNKSINLQKDFLKKIEHKEKKNKQRGRPVKTWGYYSSR
jgi:ribosomal protein S19